MPEKSILSNIPATHSTNHRLTKSCAAHLYLRGNIYYFRFAFPKKFREAFGQTEIRVSLQTGFRRQAQKLAGLLWSCVEELLVADRESTLHEIKEVVASKLKEIIGVYTSAPKPDINKLAWLTGLQKEDGYVDNSNLKEHLAQRLNEIFPSSSQSTPLLFSEVTRRFDSLQTLYLEEIDNKLYDPASEVWIDNDKSESMYSVSDSEWLEHEYVTILKPILNNPKKLVKCYFPNILYELVNKGIFLESDFTSENIFYILNEYHKVKININRIMLKRTNGDYTFERKFKPQVIRDIPQLSLSSSPSGERKLNLRDFIEKFIDTKVKDGDWTTRNIPTHRNRIETFLDVVGDIPLSEIDRNKLREFRDILRKLPPNRHKKKYSKKSVKELIALNLKETLSIKTINVTMQAISGMFEWGIEEGLIENNPAKNLSIKDNRQVIELRDAFTEQEVRKIFFSGDYLSSAFKNPAYYWVPLIGLYTGMRLEEICQLHTQDIYQEDEIWIIDINLDSHDGVNDKILKSKNSIRKIPIHNDLVELGFIKYYESMKDNSKRLFPLLNKTDKSPKYGKQVGKQFSNWIKRKGICGKKSFHSLRHTFSDYFKKRNLQTNIFTQVFGHEQISLSMKQYGSKFSVQQCYYEVISKLHWS